MLQLRNVSKTFGDALAVHPADLTIEVGRTTALLGPSGCGKSTILRMIIGLIAPDRGSIVFDGAEITPENVLEVRRKMGYVIQDGGLFPHLTAEENVTLVARFLQWPAERIASRLEELRELTHFPADGLVRYPLQLSGGQRQRVSLMRALMLDPQLLLLDEPLGALDPMIRAELQSDLRDIFRALGKTVVLVTHDMGEAGFLADRILLMRDGRIVQQGQFFDLVHSPAEPFVTQFINAQRSPLDSLEAKQP
jgi:osmoprotectant transport system ATP-binding protein